MKKELFNYVEGLFSNYKQTKEIQEMKEEIYSNLEAKIEDYLEQGMSRSEALEQAVKHIDTVDFLIDGNERIYINRFLIELVQTSLIYSLLIWIVTVPSRVMINGRLLNDSLMLASILVGVVYLALLWRMNDITRETVSIVNIKLVRKWEGKIWLVWTAFILTLLVSVSAVRFGSNLWFWRPISISGPYQFAQLMVTFCSPFVSIIIPLLFHKASQLIQKHEVNG